MPGYQVGFVQAVETAGGGKVPIACDKKTRYLSAFRRAVVFARHERHEIGRFNLILRVSKVTHLFRAKIPVSDWGEAGGTSLDGLGGEVRQVGGGLMVRRGWNDRWL